MFEKLKEIFEGHRNHLLPPKRIRELIQEVSSRRLAICLSCEFNSTPNRIKAFSTCLQCGCPLIQKSKSLQSTCPINKWLPIVSPEEEHNIKLTLNGEKDSKEGSAVEASDSN